jgi:hypothetical protein
MVDDVIKEYRQVKILYTTNPMLRVRDADDEIPDTTKKLTENHPEV